ncbi:hypothetical protein BCV70DRAFT_50990 [Testicularia cyperi]|uniref:Uncharacterized protein n=1 Tax=Testicularia cyperi TaxID=1882483 RepID=A0A317XHI9_9BASI|nr:hypothetical protein BCV70DRAFT_50990 [Testicularia cyperi]
MCSNRLLFCFGPCEVRTALNSTSRRERELEQGTAVECVVPGEHGFTWHSHVLGRDGGSCLHTLTQPAQAPIDKNSPTRHPGTEHLFFLLVFFGRNAAVGSGLFQQPDITHSHTHTHTHTHTFIHSHVLARYCYTHLQRGLFSCHVIRPCLAVHSCQASIVILDDAVCLEISRPDAVAVM